MLFANNCNTTLNGGITAVATSMVVTSATGFPAPTGSQYFYCTLADAATQTTIEIVKVTAVSGTTFTIVRGQDGTTGTIFASGAVVSLRLVRASLNDFPKLDEANTFTQAQTFSALTAGRVPYSGTGGLQTDSANLTFNGNSLKIINTQYNQHTFYTSQTGNVSNMQFASGSNYNYGIVGSVSGTGVIGGDVYALGWSSNDNTTFNPVLNWTSVGGVYALNCIGVGAATPAASGAGITFPATQAASSDVNTLDDYEEGTWIPTTSGMTTVTGTPAWTGKYTKIGNQVTVQFQMRSATVTIPATSSITNLPFSASAGFWGTAGNDGLVTSPQAILATTTSCYFSTTVTYTSYLSGSITYTI